MGFRKKVTIRRMSGGHINDDGYYVPGTAEEIVIRASVQPLNKDDRAQYTQALPEGTRTANMLKMYTSYQVRSARQATATSEAIEADVLTYLGKSWRIIMADAYQSGVISHYKAILQEVDDAGITEKVSS